MGRVVGEVLDGPEVRSEGDVGVGEVTHVLGPAAYEVLPGEEGRVAASVGRGGVTAAMVVGGAATVGEFDGRGAGIAGDEQAATHATKHATTDATTARPPEPARLLRDWTGRDTRTP